MKRIIPIFLIAISAMWGHYADKNHGVCIVFDKNKLVEILKKQNCLYKAVN